jgi:TolB-like protein
VTPERWKRVNELFESALARTPRQREAFLVEACGDEAALRDEVDSLLTAHDEAGGFLDAPAVASLSEPVPTLEPGARLGPYEVVALLGVGGMGEVYRARDPRLGRDVAIKVLCPRPGSGDPTLRLEREARAVAALSHPNILAVYDVGVAEKVPYVVSELLEGETLRARLGVGRMPGPAVVDLARQAAAGLAAAHDKGIVHRDLKPENLFLTTDGRLKILDFGLARRIAGPATTANAPTARLLTQPGTVLGTVGYMAPEQVRGRAADTRSDVFSYGAVLYEMLSGRRAFTGDSGVETMSAILTEEPPSLSADGVPAGLEQIVLRCLRKDPDERFPSAHDVAAALDAHVAGGTTPAVVSGAKPRGGRRSVAVLPFRDLGGDPESAHLGLSLADATITELARLHSLLVRPTSAIVRYEGAAIEPGQAARDLAVDAVVDARFQRAGSRLRVTVQLVDAVEGRPLWAGKIDTSLDDVFEMQDEVARNIARALEVEWTPDGERRLADGVRAPGPNAAAYELYVRGKRKLFGESLSDFVSALDWFEKAREADPRFALAWAGLADAYARLAFQYQPEGDWYARAQAMCEKALALDPRLPEARYVRARLHWAPQANFDHAAAIRDLVPALRARPNLEEAYVLLGNVLHHVGLTHEAQALFERAEAVSPGHPRARAHVVMCLLALGRYGDALRVSPVPRHSYSFLEYLLALCQIHLGRLDEAEGIMADVARQFPNDVLVLPLRGLVAARRGDEEAADRHIRITEEQGRSYGHYHHLQYDVACIHALLGRKEPAVAWLTQAARGGYPCISHFECDEFLDPLRGTASFERLLQELRAESEGFARIYAELRA